MARYITTVRPLEDRIAQLGKYLTVLGASELPDGGLSIDMTKYLAMHRCEEHRKEPFTQDLNACVPCLRALLRQVRECGQQHFRFHSCTCAAALDAATPRPP